MIFGDDFGAMRWRLLISMQTCTVPVHVHVHVPVCRFSSKSHGGSFPIESFPYPDNGTFGDHCRSRGGSYDFEAMETFVQHAKIYKHTDFHPNRTGAVFP